MDVNELRRLADLATLLPFDDPAIGVPRSCIAEFNAAANPAAILALIARLEAAERDAARWKWFVSQLTSMEGLEIVDKLISSLETQDFVTYEQFTAATDYAMQQESAK